MSDIDKGLLVREILFVERSLDSSNSAHPQVLFSLLLESAFCRPRCGWAARETVFI